MRAASTAWRASSLSRVRVTTVPGKTTPSGMATSGRVTPSRPESGWSVPYCDGMSVAAIPRQGSDCSFDYNLTSAELSASDSDFLRGGEGQRLGVRDLGQEELAEGHDQL